MEHLVRTKWDQQLELHQVLRKAREVAGLTQTKAAARLGIAKSTLSRLETKQGPITATRLTEIARLYGVKPSELLDGTITPVPSGDDDCNDVGIVVTEVERVIADGGLRPSPEKVSAAVVEILKLARADAQARAGAEFDVQRYVGVARAMLN